MLHRFIPALLIAAGPALADPMTQTVTPGNTLAAPPAAWLGADPHVVIMGTMDGYTFDMQYLDLDAADIGFESKREYVAAGDAFAYFDFEFGMQTVLEGVEKTVEIEVETTDFNRMAALPFDLSILPVDPEALADGQAVVEVEFEWEQGGTSVNGEVAGWTGTVTIAMDDGFQAAEPAGGGMIGGFVTATSGEDSLVMSFTVPMQEFEIDD